MSQEKDWTLVNRRSNHKTSYQVHRKPKKRYYKRYRKIYPITSYGIILYTKIDSVIHYLIAQRRDTIEYVDFIRGYYSKNYISSFFSLMSSEERKRMLNYTFDELWDDLWINKQHRIYKEEYERARSKFESIQNDIPSILDETKGMLEEPPWGFPKGKRNTHENEVSCALREFEEETKISASQIDIINYSPYIEVYKGSNMKDYSTHYYLAHTHSPPSTTKMSTTGIRKETISEEISNLKWVTLEQAKNIIHPRRVELLERVNKFIL